MEWTADRVQRKLSAGILQQHRALLLHLLRDRLIGDRVDGPDGVGVIEETDLVHGAQNAMHHVIQARLRHAAVGDGLPETREIRAVGLLLVQAGQRRGNRAVRGPPVRHDETRKAPAVLEHVVQQVRILARVHAVHQIVGAHHGLHMGILDGDLECQQVALACPALVDLHVGEGAAGLLIVQGVVLDAADHVPVLNGANVSGGDFSGEDRVLALGFESAAVARLAADQIDVPTEIHVESVRGGLGADHGSELVGQVRVPRRRAGEGRGKGSGGRAGVGEPQAAIHEVQIGNAQGRDTGDVATGASRQRPGASGSRYELQLLRLGHARQHRGGALV